jgi:hypothetical protein
MKGLTDVIVKYSMLMKKKLKEKFKNLIIFLKKKN